MGWEDMADQSSLPNKFRLSFSTGAMKHPPDGFIPVLRDRQFLDGFLLAPNIVWHLLAEVPQHFEPKNSTISSCNLPMLPRERGWKYSRVLN